MSFPRYEKYKHSGVEWLGEVPEGWEVLAVWLLFELGRGRVISNGEILDNAGGYPVYSSQTENNGEMGKLNTYDFDGDYITWTTDGANAGTVFRRSGKFNCTNVCGTLKAKKETILLNYCTHALSISTASFVRQDINPKLMNNVMATIKIPIPPLPEQQTIASFLDRETGKIDALVAEQERLIDLLKEKRQAVISHAVTKGLDPDAPMKDSGIEWLGEVPEGWEVRKLNRLSTKIGDGLHGTPIYVDESDYYFINGNNLMNGSILVTDTTRNVAEEEYENHFIEMDDNTLLMSINGTVGNLAFYNGERIVLGKSAAYINCSERISRIFLSYYLQSSAIRTYIDLEVTGTTIFNFSLQSIRTLLTVLPPPDEQYTITAFLDSETAKIDALITEAQQAILLLKERRSALISAAVTGKIDVRKTLEQNT